jgi:ribulose-phosphate 3-epimerase
VIDVSAEKCGWDLTAIVPVADGKLPQARHIEVKGRIAGADTITVHPEAGPHIHRSLQHIKSLGKRAGVVLNPGTPAKMLDYLIDMVDLVLVMSVNPGFGGQSFIDSQLRKIAAIRKMIDASGRDIDLQVDGGIDQRTAPLAIDAGADALVAGTATFRGGPEAYAANIRALRGA